MGEMSDYYKEQDIGTEFDPPQPTATTWVTREGQVMPVKKMTDAHLVNTIRYLRRCNHNRMTEATLDIASLISDDAEVPDGVWGTDNWTPEDDMDADDFIARRVPTWPALLAEAKRRGLQL